MAYQTVFVLMNIISSLGALAASIVWTMFSDVNTFNGGYGFYWFITLLSLIFGLCGALYFCTAHNASVYYVKSTCTLFFILWLAASVVVAYYLQQCMALVNNANQCLNDILTVTFGFLNVLVWLILAICV